MNDAPLLSRGDKVLLTFAICAGIAVGLLLTGCDSPTTTPPPSVFDPNPNDGFGATYGPDFAASAFVADVTNSFYPLAPGTTRRYEAETDEGMEVIVVEVTSDTRQVAGVTARVVRDRVYLDSTLIEDTFDWHAQDRDGNVWYLGEETCEYEDSECVSTAGSWEAGVDGARAGIIMPATPTVGQRYYQEYYAAEAEDRAEVLATDETVTVPAGTFTGCVQTYDTTPLDPTSLEHKYHCPGVGTVLVENLKTEVREELASLTDL